MFQLHPQLVADTVEVGSFELSRLLISKDANYPWFILVPQREDVTEIHHLGDDDRQQLFQESCRLSEAMVSAFSPDKMNVAALGNVVSQLHVHHIARFHEDAAWPAPIWGVVPAKTYKLEELQRRVRTLVELLEGEGFTVAE